MPRYVLPAPSAVALAFSEYGSYLLMHSSVTTYEVLFGFTVGVLAAVFTAIGVLYSSFLRATIYPIVVAIQSIPKLALAPVILLWLGIGIWSKVVMVVLISYFPILVNTLAGLGNVDRSLLDLVHAMSASELKIFSKIRFPHAVPYLFDGLRIALPLAMVGAIVAEFVGSNAGLGYVLLLSTGQYNTPLLFATIVTITVITLSLYVALDLVAKKITKWKPS